MLISSDQRINMLRAGAYFPPSRNGRSWSPSAAAPGHQERLALVMGILYPLRFARPPKRGTVMRNARRSCVKIHFSSADDADNADFSSLYYTEWLLFICAICVICGRKIKEAFLTHPPTETRKFSLTVCVPVAAELLNF